MRTTLTLDPDVERILRQRMRDRGLSMARLVNDAVRRAFSGSDPEPTPYDFPIHDCGGPFLVDITKANHLAGELDDQYALAKLREGR